MKDDKPPATPIPNLEELLKVATENKDKIIKSSQKVQGMDNAHQFIIAMGLASGRYKVFNKVIYNAYILWTQNPMPHHKFFNELSKIFEPFKTRDHRGYYLNLKPYTLMQKAEALRIKPNE